MTDIDIREMCTIPSNDMTYVDIREMCTILSQRYDIDTRDVHNTVQQYDQY